MRTERNQTFGSLHRLYTETDTFFHADTGVTLFSRRSSVPFCLTPSQTSTEAVSLRAPPTLRRIVFLKSVDAVTDPNV